LRSIQAKLTATILAIFLIALSSLGGLNYWKAREILTQSITADMTEKSQNAATDIHSWLEARKAEMTIMAAAPMVQSGNQEDILPFLANVAKENKVYDAVGYIAPDGLPALKVALLTAIIFPN
jgi:hypothetical protein